MHLEHWLVIGLILTTCVGNAGASQPTDNSPRAQLLRELGETKSFVAQFKSDPYVGMLIQPVLDQFPAFERSIPLGLEKAAALQIDVILQSHDFIGASSAEEQQALASQRKLREYLEAHPCDIIGYEGSQLDDVTIKALVDDAYAQAIQRRMVITRADVERGMNESLPYNGVLLYLKDHPAADVVGTEDLALVELHNTVLNLLGQGIGIGSPLEELNLRLSDLRSDLAIAKLSLKLTAKGKKHGVATIGYLHEQRLRSIFDRFGIRGTFINLG